MNAVTAAAQALADACVKPGHWLTLGTDQRAGYMRLVGVVLQVTEKHQTLRAVCIKGQRECRATYASARRLRDLTDSPRPDLFGTVYSAVYLQSLAADQSAAERCARLGIAGNRRESPGKTGSGRS